MHTKDLPKSMHRRTPFSTIAGNMISVVNLSVRAVRELFS